MALIKDAKGRREDETPSGYERLFGNRKLGMLISKLHSTVISTGNELEHILASRLTNTAGISIQNINKAGRIFIGAKAGHDLNADCVIRRDGKVWLIEIKDGDTFDTKKIAGELESLKLAKAELIKQGILERNILIHFCSFYAADHAQIEKGAKGLLAADMAMTGRELCELLSLNFDKIVEERKKHQKENVTYFISELLKIPEIIALIKSLLK
jgi:hypothetical protein